MAHTAGFRSSGDRNDRQPQRPPVRIA